MPESNLTDNFCCFTRECSLRSLVNLGIYSKKPTAKVQNFALRKKEEKTRMIKVIKSCHQVTWT